MPVKEVLQSTKTTMTKSLDYFKVQLSKVRTGRASGNLLDDIYVDYYGAPTPLSQVATVSVPDARSIMIQPFDRTMISAIDRAIQLAGLGFNPQNDGTVIRIPVPPLTEERRRDFVKQCKKYAEECKIAVRGVRRDSMEVLKKLEKGKAITEDDRKRGEDEIQKATDEYIKKTDDILNAKEKELMDH